MKFSLSMIRWTCANGSRRRTRKAPADTTTGPAKKDSTRGLLPTSPSNTSTTTSSTRFTVRSIPRLRKRCRARPQLREPAARAGATIAAGAGTVRSNRLLNVVKDLAAFSSKESVCGKIVNSLTIWPPSPVASGSNLPALKVFSSSETPFLIQFIFYFHLIIFFES